MSATTSIRTRITTAAISTAAALLAAWAFLSARDYWSTEPLVDTSAQIAALLERRRAEALADPTLAIEPTDEWPPPLRLEPVDEDVARVFFPALFQDRFRFDPFLYYRRVGPADNWRWFNEHPGGGFHVRTNSLGMREDAEPAVEPPDVRVFITGDSHVGGVVNNEDSAASQLEALLAAARPEQSVEVLNAGTGGYDLYNYLGVLERYADLRPQVLVVVVYGGNDFASSMPLQRYFHRRGRSAPAAYTARSLNLVEQGARGVVPQELWQVCYLLNNPEDVQASVDTAAAITLELERRARERGVRLLLVYLPPPYRGQPQHFGGEIRAVLDLLELDEDQLALSDRIADEWLAFLRKRGIDHLDLRESFRASQERYYWLSDHHLNIQGHRALAEALLPLVEQLVR